MSAHSLYVVCACFDPEVARGAAPTATLNTARMSDEVIGTCCAFIATACLDVIVGICVDIASVREHVDLAAGSAIGQDP